MKKQLRFVLFAVLVLVMVLTMALMASATGTPEPAGTDNYQVVDASGTHVGYYATLTDALGGVTADGYKVIVLKDVTEATGVKLDKAFTYTITGGADGKKIAFADTVKSSRSTSAYVYLDLTAGSVTLENLSLDTSAPPTTEAKEYLLINGAAALTLDGVTASGKAANFLYVNTKVNVTVKGDTNLNFDGNIFYFYGSNAVDSTLTVTGGTFAATGHFINLIRKITVSLSGLTVNCTDGSVVAFTNANAKGSAVTVGAGADVKTAGSVFHGTRALNPAATITVEAGATLTGATIFDFTTSATVSTTVNVTLNGGEFHVVGADGKLANAATIFTSFTMGTGATAENTKIYFDDDAVAPDVAFDTHFDWNKIAVIFSGFEGVYEINEAGTYDLTSFDCDFYKVMKAYIESRADDIDKVRFPHASLDLSGFIPIVVNHPDAVLNISGTYELADSEFLVRVQQGTVNVNGAFSGGATGNLFLVEGGTLHISGGSYQMDGTPLNHKGGTIVIDDGTFDAQDLLIDSNVPTGTVGEVCIKAGTFTANTIVKIQGEGNITVEGGMYTTDATSYFKALSGTLNITGGSFTGAALVELQSAALNISGGTFAVNKVVDITTATTVTVSGGTYQPFNGGAATYFVLNNVDAVLTVSGGTYADATVGIHAIAGELTVSGGHFFIRKNQKGIFVDGAAVVSVTPNGANAKNDPSFTLLAAATNYTSAGIFLSANAAEATLTVSGGKFGTGDDVTFASSDDYYAIWCNAAIAKDKFIISGGSFLGGPHNGTVVLKKGNLSITGGTFYGFRNVLMWGTSTVHISGGSFNPLPGRTTNYLIHVHKEAPDSDLTITGGEFNDFQNAVRISSVSQVTITGGTFTQRASDSASDDVFIYNGTAGANITVGEIKTVGEGDEAEDVAVGPTVHLQTVGNLIKVDANLAATVTVNGGTFNTLSANNIIFNIGNAAAIKELTINGGSFSLSGEGTTLIPEVYDVADSPVTVKGGHVTVADGAALPMYLNIDTKKLSIAINGNISTLIISAPLTGDDNVIDTPAEQIAAIRAYFTNVTFGAGIEESFEWIDRIILNHEDAVLLLKDKEYTIDSEYLVRVIKGTLRIEGGNYTVKNGAKLFIVDEGTADAVVSITGITLTLGNRSNYILDVADNTIIVKGFSELKLSEADEYNIASYADIGLLLRPILEDTFTNATIGSIEIETWVPITVDGDGVVLNVTGGDFVTDGDIFFRVKKGTLKLSGGKFSGATKAIHLTGGTLELSGGHIVVPKDGYGVYIDGAADVTVGGDAVIELLASSANQGAIYTTANAGDDASLEINNGRFGNLANSNGDRFYALYLLGAANVTINGGQFYGGSDSGAVIVKGGTLDITNGEFYGYRNLYITAKATVNIEGGSFNPRPGQADAILLHIGDKAANTELEIKGGEFNSFMNALMVDAAATIDIKAGTFNPRTENVADTDVVILVQKSGVVLTIGEINEDVSSGPVAPMAGKTNLLRVSGSSSITLTINGGTFMDEGAGKPVIVMGELAIFESLAIKGGTFELSGEGLELIPTAFDKAGTHITVTGGHVILDEGAALPMYAFIDTTALKLTVNGPVDNLVINQAGNYPIATVVDQLNIIKAYFSDITFAEGVEEAMSLMKVTLNHEGAVVTLENLTLLVTDGHLFRLVAGELRLIGGSYTAGANGTIFDLQGNAKLTLEGGTYLVKGKNSKFMSVADGADISGISMADITLTIGALGQSPLDLTLQQSSMDTLIINGLSGLTLDKAQEYVINGIEDIEEMIRVPLANAGFAENLEVELTTWVPICINNAGAIVTVTGGTYVSAEGASYMFDVRAGKLNITGGQFTFGGDAFCYLKADTAITVEGGEFIVTEGDFIFVSGDDVEITFGKKGDDTKCPVVNVPKGGNVLHVEKVLTKTTIYNGRFVKDVIDRAHYTSHLIFYNSVPDAGSQLDIYGGYFEATRILLDYKGKVTTTIYGGTFKSNLVSENMTEADYTSTYFTDKEEATRENPFVFNPQKHVVTTNARLLNLIGAGASLTIYGGEFDGGFGASIIHCNSAKSDGFFLYGGSFTGASRWFATDQAVNLVIGSHQLGADGMPKLDINGKPVAGTIAPSFTAKDNITQYGFNLSHGADGGNARVVITAGTFTMMDLAGRRMWNIAGPVTLDIYGGDFTITLDNAVKDKNRVVNSRIFYPYTGGKLDMNIYGGNFVAAQILQYRYGGGTLNIYGGTFRSNYKAAEIADYSRMFQMSHNDTTFNIYGGSFYGTEYTHSIFSMNVATGNSMYLNILGGTITGGAMWFHSNKPGHVTIDKNPLVNDGPFEGFEASNPKFVKLSAKTSSNVYGFYITNAFYGGTFNVNYMVVTLDTTSHATSLFRVEGGEITFNPASGKDIQIDTACYIFQIGGAFRGHATIKGGQFTARDGTTMFYFSTKAIAPDSANLMNSTFTIEKGAFKCLDTSTMFNIKSEVPEYTFRIQDGTFESEDAATFMLNVEANSSTPFIVDGGTFTSTAAHMIYIERNTEPMVINGGTFLFEDRDGITDENAIIYVAGKGKSALLLKGGTFVDNRTGNEQSIIKMNYQAEIRFEGDFKLYVSEKKPYFLRDFVIPAYSMPMLESDLGTYKDEGYYVCFGYCFNEYAPIMLNRPELRPVIGAEGITFTSRVPAASVAHLATLGTVSYGTLIFPTDVLMDGWQNGTDFLQALEGSKYVMVEAKNGIVTEEDGSLTIRASLIKIKEQNYTKRFTGIAYAKVVDDEGNETYYWATHASAGISTTMREVAEYAINDTNSAPLVKNDRTYCYVSIMKDKTYSRYASVLQNALRKYLPASVKPKS